MLKKLFAALALLLLAAGNTLAAETDLLARISRAGEQRMLAQRIAKSYSLIGLNVQPFVAKQELDQAVKRFEENLAFLETAPTDAAKTSLTRLRNTWQPFRKAARGVPRQTGAIWLSHQADEVLAAAELVVRDLQNSGANATSGRLVAQAGRQRMLSQRIVKAYLLVSWGDTSEVTREELDGAVNEFAGALNALRQRSENSPAVSNELNEMAQSWEWMQAALAAEGASSYRLIVAEAGEAILQSAERLTTLYATPP